MCGESRGEEQHARVETVGVIGLGIVGRSLAMSANLVKAGLKRWSASTFSRRAARIISGLSGAACTPLRGCSRSLPRDRDLLPSAGALAETAAALAKSARKNQIVIETSTLPIPAK